MNNRQRISPKERTVVASGGNDAIHVTPFSVGLGTGIHMYPNPKTMPE